MNDQLPLEAQLSLYGNTVSRDTGQYFCNSRPFSKPRFGNKVSILPSGETAFNEIFRAMKSANHFIWIADWQMSHDVELLRSADPKRPNRLHHVIEQIIKTRPVQVRVLLYGSINDTIPGTYDNQAKGKLESLNKKEYPGSVAVFRQKPTTGQLDSIDYSHHQKFVVVDGILGFIGGIDVANGRWETPNYDVIADPERFVINEMYNPGAKKIRGTTTREKKLIEDFNFAEPWNGQLIDEGCQPRMPWQDVHIRIEGPSVVDIHRNFVRRWNMTRSTAAPWDLDCYHDYIDKKWLKKLKCWSVLEAMQEAQTGTAIVQIVRSVSSTHLYFEGTRHDDLELYLNGEEREVWLRCLPAWRSSHQDNILNALKNCIRSANNYIYIETQFFITGFGSWGKHDSTKFGNQDNGIKNGIGDALASRIGFHIRAKTPFHVYLVIPAHPEGSPDAGSVWKQQWLAIASIKHGDKSLINQVKKILKEVGRSPDEWIQYLTILNMRNFGATIQYARDPETNDEDFKCEIGRYVVSEQIYIHSKLLIVDDAVAIVGSANTNDRSLTGNGDTEIAAVIVDTNGVEYRDLGSPFKVHTRKFARELRKQLWRKHFGFEIKDTEYFNAGRRAERASVPVPAPLPFPPRSSTSDDQLQKISGGTTIEQILEKPCAPDVVRAIQAIAAHNRKTYEQVFTHTPRNFRQFDTGLTYYKLPYPLSVDQNSRNSLNRLHEPYYNLSSAEGANVKRFEKSNGIRVGIYNFEIAKVKEAKKHLGVIPPRLQPAFMTKKLAPHQTAAAKNIEYGRRQVQYDDGTIHDVDKAMEHLKEKLVGFFLEAPLNWGVETKVTGDPTKHLSVDVAVNMNVPAYPTNQATT
ncbi:phospholipase D-like domain-containing protein [Massilia sp. SR12]